MRNNADRRRHVRAPFRWRSRLLAVMAVAAVTLLAAGAALADGAFRPDPKPSGASSPQATTPGEAIVSAGDTMLSTGSSGAVQVRALGVSEGGGLDSYDVTIDFDPSVINVDDVTQGVPPFDSDPSATIDNGAGTVRLSGSSGGSGASGHFTFAMLQITGVSNGTSDLEVTVNSFTGAESGDELATSTDDGLVEVVDGSVVATGDALLGPGDSADVELWVFGVDNPDGVGAYEMTVSYDPSVVSVDSVQGGEAPFDDPPLAGIDGTSGEVRISGFADTIPGPTGDVHPASLRITAQAVGDTDLDVEVTDLVDADEGDTVPHTAAAGTVKVIRHTELMTTDESMAPGGNGTVELWARDVSHPEGLGSYEVTLGYDPAVMSVDGVSGEGTPFGPDLEHTIDNDEGAVSITGFQAALPGPRGNVQMATLEISANDSGSTPVSIGDHEVIAGDTGRALPTTSTPGTVIVGEGATLFAPDSTVGEGQTVAIPVDVRNFTHADGLGGYEIHALFDPSVVKIDAVEGGDPPFDAAAAAIDNDNGVVEFIGFGDEIPGPTGDHTVAVLQARGVAKGSTNIELGLGPADAPHPFLTTAEGDEVPATGGTAIAEVFAPPGAPAITAVSPGDQQIDVEWTAPSDDGGSPITSYTVTCSPVEGEGPSGSTAVDAGTNLATVGGLENGLEYTCTVVATNAAGDSEPSELSDPVIPEGEAVEPEAPTITSVEAGEGQIEIAWEPPDDVGDGIDQYEVICTPEGGGPSASATVDGDTLSATVTGLSNGTTYTCQVAADDGPLSAQSSPVTPFTTPGPPRRVRAFGGNSLVRVTWDPPVSDGGESIDLYRATCTPIGGDSETTADTPDGAARSVRVTGLENGTAYTCVVAAENARGEGPQSTPSNEATPRDVPGSPTNVSAIPGNGSIALEFDAPADDGGSPIRSYTGVCEPLSGPEQSETILDGLESPITIEITGLANGDPYDCYAIASNAGGDSEPSDVVSAMPRTTPGRPTGISARAGDSQGTVVWRAPRSNGGAAIDNYRVACSEIDGDDEAAVETGTGSAREAVVGGLSNGTAYRCSVTAINAAGDGPPSNPSNEFTPHAVPDAPGNLTAVEGAGLLTLQFDPPADDGGSPITSYTGTCEASGWPTRSETILDGLSGPLDMGVTGLANGVEYTCRVAATNDAGDSDPSAEVSATPRTTPAAPKAVKISAGDSQTDIDWTAPRTDGGSPVTGYEVTSDPDSPNSPLSVGDVTSTTMTGLENGTTYRFRVSAVNEAGTGPPSPPSRPGTPAAVPGEPAITGTSAGDGEVTVEWDPPADDGGSRITRYLVVCFPVGGGVEAIGAEDVPGTQTTASVSGLANGQDYRCTVTAFNEVGSGDPSDQSGIVTPSD